ncbi:MAG TPA: EAL domain-containing protein [Methylotenera sp.]|nr:EAL domain-containing protein [Methylotenera sp.]
MDTDKSHSIVPKRIWLTTATILLLLITFAIYVYTEKRAYAANQERQVSYQLADQLRHSSDDLTRMVRTYVATRDIRYKIYFQNILDIRNGKIARPSGYSYIYWDLVLTEKIPPPAQTGKGVALLDLMREAGFTSAELEKLAQAKANSDALTNLEFDAIRLIESSRGNDEMNRTKAIAMLHGDVYHQAKSQIMQPINEFFILMDQRTAAAVKFAENIALLFRWIFALLVCAAIFMNWRSYQAIVETLGGSVDTVHAHMTRIGQGDLLKPIPIPVHSENSVLASLSDMQAKLRDHQFQNSQIQKELAESKSKLNRLLNHLAEGVYEVDTSGNCTFVNKSFLTILGFRNESEVLGKNVHALIHHHRQDGRDYPNSECRIYRAFRSNQEVNVADEVFWRKDGSPIPVEYWSVPVIQDGKLLGATVTFVDISSRKAAEARIETLAFYDPLTNLPNRRLLIDRLEQTLTSCKRNEREGALLFIDLDNFKTVNDTLGHDVGDILLQQVAARLTPCLRMGDTVARLGGDEFVVILKELSSDPVQAAAQAETTGKKVLAALSQPYQLGMQECISTCSIGVTLLNHPESTIDELMKQADIAMYQAKKTGRNCLRFFDPEMQNTIVNRAAIELNLRKALVNQQFKLFYQIQVDADSQPIGAEALIRWVHPEQGIVSPATFIPLAEETGMIVPIGHWVIEAACAQIQAWQQHSASRNLILAVNISAKQFRQERFIDEVKKLMASYAINPKLLKLELTESLMLEDIDKTVVTMNALKTIGVQFSLDDFGTGYSSLQYLKRLPLDQLKIDQSFVNDIASDENDRAIVRTVIAMAQSLNVDVIAEGVETAEQQAFLLQNGCRQYQGYLFGKPMPIEEFNQQLHVV